MKETSKDGKLLSIKDSEACRILIAEMEKRLKPVVLSASLRPSK